MGRSDVSAAEQLFAAATYAPYGQYGGQQSAPGYPLGGHAAALSGYAAAAGYPYSMPAAAAWSTAAYAGMYGYGNWMRPPFGG